MSEPKRYRPVFKGKDAEMRFDESGDWTSLACYYSLHDRVVRGEAHVAALQAENERLRKAGDAVIEKLAEAYAGDVSEFDHAHVFKAWIEAKQTRS
jgi:hypothetical protein